jgi:hypothetical protein
VADGVASAIKEPSASYSTGSSASRTAALPAAAAFGLVVVRYA